MKTQLAGLDEHRRIGELKDKLTTHPIYGHVETLPQLRCFMEHHVFAVWDFMSLLKSLQAAVAPTRIPWMPAAQPELRRFVNEIVLGEESDEYEISRGRRFNSHFELYLLSMEEVQADTQPIRHFISAVSQHGIETGLRLPTVPIAAAEFVRSTFGVIGQQKEHCIASAFAFGREDLIPGMFSALLGRMKIRPEHAPNFHYYLRRHTQLDGDTHGPLALQLVSALCGQNATKQREAIKAAEKALYARILFWDQVRAAMLQASARVQSERRKAGARAGAL